MSFLAWCALLTLLLWLGLALDIVRGSRSIRALREFPSQPPPHSPTVSIVVAARNEERNLRVAVTSLLRLAYPAYELIVVDDRSDDATGTILDELAAQEPRLRVVHVTELPPGWLGKNHALHCGAQLAAGEILLFTDADIVMEQTALSRAVRMLQDAGLDHLAATPRMTMPSPLLQIFGTAFIIFFSLFARPWKARDPRSPFHVGIGAFNLVRTSAYRAVGGHETIRLRPDDDLKLGKILKRGGFRCDVAYAPDFLGVEWYSSVGEAIRGLEKNAFAGCDYRLWLAGLGVVFHLTCTLWPYLALLCTRGVTQVLYAAVVLLLTALVADCAPFHGTRRRYALGFPLGSALFVWIILRTTYLNLRQGGIYWRGTFYPLAELKQNRV